MRTVKAGDVGHCLARGAPAPEYHNRQWRASRNDHPERRHHRSNVIAALHELDHNPGSKRGGCDSDDQGYGQRHHASCGGGIGLVGTGGLAPSASRRINSNYRILLIRKGAHLIAPVALNNPSLAPARLKSQQKMAIVAFSGIKPAFRARLRLPSPVCPQNIIRRS
jgi:hypothetical protein